MSRTARRAPALLPSGRRLNWRVRSADDHEAVIRRLSGGCHITLTVGKFTSGCGAQNHRPLVSRLIVGVLADCCDGVAAHAGRANASVSRLRLVESRVEGSPLVGCHGSLTAGLRPRFNRLAEFRLWGFLAPVIASSKL
jgi:hypothetical protein